MCTEARQHNQTTTEAGQSIVLIAFIIVGILAFVGLAADAGFLFARRAQFSAAVDAAVLAAVRDLDPADPALTAPNARAGQFLAANRWPTATLTSFASSSSVSVQGIPQYTMTATWPVDTFFLRLVGIDQVNVTHSATGVFSSQSEVYVPTAFQIGHLRSASQYIFGPDSCSQDGDPVNAKYATDTSTPNGNFAVVDEGYQYDIRVPSSYGEDYVRVEIFDPDSANFNLEGNTTEVTYSNAYRDTDAGGTPAADLSCMGSPGDGEICAIDTGEDRGSSTENPLWFLRVDENFDNCTPLPGDRNGDTITEYRLYYVDGNGQRQTLARYVATNVTETDLRWVAPGTSYSAGVAADEGSFDVDVTGLPEVDGVRHIYMDVRTTTGSAKNVWDVRAGPRYDSLASDANQRNLQLANNPGAVDNDGVTVVALGRMPLQHYEIAETLTLPLAPVAREQGGGAIYATTFDYESGNPINFTISTVSPGEFNIDGAIVGSNPDPANWETTCEGGTNCDNSWMIPQFAMGIPGDPSNPSNSTFFGGNLQAEYAVQNQDAHVWSVSIQAGEPFLTE